MSVSLLTKKAILKSACAADFSAHKCILTISVGQANHEGEKFLSTVIATDKKFSFCTVMVCDSLQRFTMKFSSPLSLEEIHCDSNFLGDEWINRNFKALKRLTMPYTLSRWDCWIAHPHFKEKKFLIDELYSHDELFKETVDRTAASFVERKQDRLMITQRDAIYLSKQYLLEECAVMLIQADDLNGFEIYPNQRNDAMDYVHKKIISSIDCNLMRPITVKFKNISLIEVSLT